MIRYLLTPLLGRARKTVPCHSWVVGAADAKRFQDLFYAAIYALDHALVLRRLWVGKLVIVVECLAERFKHMGAQRIFGRLVKNRPVNSLWLPVSSVLILGGMALAAASGHELAVAAVLYSLVGMETQQVTWMIDTKK
jgi:TRAP-type C4-dicarboxylate transport system permease large subunit